MAVRNPPTKKHNCLLIPVITKLTLAEAGKKLGCYEGGKVANIRKVTLSRKVTFDLIYR